MAGHPRHVFHHRDGVFENVMIDPLVDVADAAPGLVIPRAIRVIDVPGAEGLRLDKVGAHLEQR